jgi:hypothetical protein
MSSGQSTGPNTKAKTKNIPRFGNQDTLPQSEQEMLVRDSIRRWKEDKTDTNIQRSGLSRPKEHNSNDD